MIYSIYKVANDINENCYIGFDSNWPRRKYNHLRFYDNKTLLSYNCYFHNAMRKYGHENFEWEIIYQSLDGEHTLNVMEPYFIKKYNSYYLWKNGGYNMTLGGEGTLGSPRPKSKEWCLQHSQKLIGVKSSKNSNEACKEKLSKLWKITDKEGNNFVVKNLSQFCELHKLVYPSMVHNTKIKNNYKGFKCERIS